MPTRYLEVVNPKSKLAYWAWSPVIVLRISLVASYALFVYAGVIAVVAGIPLFTSVTPHGYTPLWGTGMAVAAFLAGIGSISDAWQRLEKWAVLALASFFFAYMGGLNIAAYADGDYARQFGGAVALIAGLLPLTRFVYLAAQSGKKRVTNGDSERG